MPVFRLYKDLWGEKVTSCKRNIRNVLAVIVAVVGIVVCIYSIAHHIELKTNGSTDFFCNINDKFSCDTVVMTKYSEIFGIPLGVFGVGFFLSMLALAGMSVRTKNEESNKKWIHTYAVMSLIGCGVSIIYGAISKFIIGAMCPSCMTIYTLCAIQFLIVVLFCKTIPKPRSIKEFIKDVLFGGGVSTVLVVACILGFLAFFNSSSGEAQTPAQALKEDTAVEVAFSDKIESIQINKKDNKNPTNDFRSGDDNAKVQMIVFSDFQCAGCAKLYNFIKTDLNELKDKILVIYKNYPVDSHCNSKVRGKYHEYACEAAMMARCLGKEGLFWEYHDKLFENRTEINSENLSLWAKELGLNDMQIDSCRISKEIKEAINRDLVVADSLGISGSPVIYLNGRRFIGGKKYNLLKLEIERLLSEDQSSGEEKTESDTDKIARLIKTKKAVLLDVREDSEWEESHFKEAVHIPLGELLEKKNLKKLPTNKVIYIHCRSGMRAQKASDILYKQGFEVYPLKTDYNTVRDQLGLTEVR